MRYILFLFMMAMLGCTRIEFGVGSIDPDVKTCYETMREVRADTLAPDENGVIVVRQVPRVYVREYPCYDAGHHWEWAWE